MSSVVPKGYFLCCPFCGSDRLENLEDTCGPVMCIDCGAAGPTKLRPFLESGGEQEDLHDAWNTGHHRRVAS